MPTISPFGIDGNSSKFVLLVAPSQVKECLPLTLAILYLSNFNSTLFTIRNFISITTYQCSNTINISPNLTTMPQMNFSTLTILLPLTRVVRTYQYSLRDFTQRNHTKFKQSPFYILNYTQGHHPLLISEVFKGVLLQWLGEDINHLFFCWYIL